MLMHCHFECINEDTKVLMMKDLSKQFKLLEATWFDSSLLQGETLTANLIQSSKRESSKLTPKVEQVKNTSPVYLS